MLQLKCEFGSYSKPTRVCWGADTTACSVRKNLKSALGYGAIFLHLVNNRWSRLFLPIARQYKGFHIRCSQTARPAMLPQTELFLY